MVDSTAKDPQPGDTSLDFAHFVRLVLDALEATHLKYLVGGAVAVWAWGEVRTTLPAGLNTSA